MAFDTESLKHFPTLPGVYIMKDSSGRVLYVGKAKNLRARVKQYFALSRDAREMVPYLTAQVETIDTLIVNSEKEALLVENNLIKKFKPKYNAILKDDKTYFSLMINHKHMWPMIRVVRFKGKPPSDAIYFGPFTQGRAAKETLELLRHLFPLRQCSDRELVSRNRPCILYDLKRCIAPCVSKCTKDEYDSLVKSVIDFLRGHDTHLLKELTKKMQIASENQEYEKADAILKMIRNIESTLEKQTVQKAGMKDIDVIGIYREKESVALTQLFFREGKLIGSHDHFFLHNAEEDEELLTSFLLQNYRDLELIAHEIVTPVALKESEMLSELLSENKKHKVFIHRPQRGEKKELLEMAKKNAEAKLKRERESRDLKEQILLSMQEELHLTNYPEKIECFDNSNISGSEPVSVRVAFKQGQKDKSAYRKYKISPLIASDDYAALREVLTRRYAKAKLEESLPDLVLIDGGRAHLNIALEVLSELDVSTVDVLAIAKEERKHTKGITLEKIFHPSLKEAISLKPNSPLLFFLQEIRDEAHRFAIAFQRLSRGKRILKSSLDDLPGIGPIKKKRLLNHFGSVKRIVEASESELGAVAGISQKDIEIIKLRLKSDS